MQHSWVLAVILGTGLLAQTPPPEPPPAPAPAPAATPAPAQNPRAEPVEVIQESPVPPEAKPIPEPTAFEKLRPSQRKLTYTLERAALAGHELGYYRSHPKAVEVREALEALVATKPVLPEKASKALPALEAYLMRLRASHGLYSAEGKKILLEAPWKDVQAAARAAAKVGTMGLEPRLQRLRSLLIDAKVDAVAPSWTEPAAPAKGKKAKAPKGPKAPEGFAAQKAITALWVKRAQAWIENTPQEVEVNGEKMTRRLPDPVQTKALADLVAWLDKDDLELLREPGFGWLDLRRLGGTPGAGLLAHASDIAAGKAPEGPAGELTLLTAYEPVLGESKFSKGEEKRLILAEVKVGPVPADLTTQMTTFELLGRSRELVVK